ncbi:hypothetical protein CKO15_04375 [Halorhodospira abdelmalekii]|uniref:transglycosylase SLT domain-containing protein n=1 Tax=Halorhodospira abdelmalekii TaxID=421629 RepID=UPI0019050393|nr:transglycosylase SLT domain-containing protein [Halorhodospira abdelmalekii]MBK1734533.1 hypothetical protein [Halorhodospira abdelmalekii]
MSHCYFSATALRARSALRLVLPLGLLLGIGLFTSACSDGTARAAPTAECSGSPAELFSEALEAARADRWQRVARIEPCLGEAHPLTAYIDFHRLRTALPDIEPAAIHRYQARYDDTPLPDVIERVAIDRYARAGRHRALLELRDTPPSRVQLRCQWLYAQFREGDREAALKTASELWFWGRSRPAACDPLFDAARAAGLIDAEAIWERLQLSFRSNEAGMMRYLTRLLGEYEGARARALERGGVWLQRLHSRPERINEVPSELPPAIRDALLAAALYRMAHTDTAAALELYQAHQEQAERLAPEVHYELTDRLAWYSVIRDISANRTWLDAYLHHRDDAELLEHRIRRAVIEQDWAAVLTWIDRLPAEQQAAARWQYWRGRAYAQLDEPQRRDYAFQAAAAQRHFWGALAAAHLGIGYTPPGLNPLPAEKAPEPLPPSAALRRIQLLIEAGEFRLADDEWSLLLRNASDATEKRRLAAQAHTHGWYSLAIRAAATARAFDVLEWRFPFAFRDEITRAAERFDLDPYLLMAIARRESAFNPHAVSGAGAAGLLQLMPATARQVAGWTGHTPLQRDDLFEPSLNALLGAAYFEHLLKRFDGNPILALAAYNAGSGRVNQWLANADLPFDVWIEAVPFRETRNYIQYVLIYRLLFAELGAHHSEEENLSAEALARFVCQLATPLPHPAGLHERCE